MNTMLSSLSLLAFIALANIALVAEEPPRIAGPPRIATIDIDKVVRESREYQTKLVDLRNEMEQRQFPYRLDRDGLKKLADQAKKFAPGSDEYRALEEKIATWDGCYVEVSDARLRREAAPLFVEIQTKAMAEIAKHAREQQLQLVINSTPSKGATTGVTMENPAVWCRCFVGLSSKAPPSSRVIYSTCPDITATIIERLNAASP